jgi:hypothetical protein
MQDSCEHSFEDTAAVFTGTARTRACLACDRVEVMLASTGEWMTLDEYMDRRIANRSAPVADGVHGAGCIRPSPPRAPRSRSPA